MRHLTPEWVNQAFDVAALERRRPRWLELPDRKWSFLDAISFGRCNLLAEAPPSLSYNFTQSSTTLLSRNLREASGDCFFSLPQRRGRPRSSRLSRRNVTMRITAVSWRTVKHFVGAFMYYLSWLSRNFTLIFVIRKTSCNPSPPMTSRRQLEGCRNWRLKRTEIRWDFFYLHFVKVLNEKLFVWIKLIVSLLCSAEWRGMANIQLINFTCVIIDTGAPSLWELVQFAGKLHNCSFINRCFTQYTSVSFLERSRWSSSCETSRNSAP